MKRLIIIIICVALIIAAYYVLKESEDEEDKKPTAIFTATPENGRINETTTEQDYPTIFFDASESKDPDGKIINYDWDFGDGNFTNESKLTYNKTYQKSGKFEVKLKVTDEDNNEDDAEPIIITIDYHKEEDGVIASGNEDIIPFPVNKEAVTSEIIVDINNTNIIIVTGSDVEISVFDANGTQVGDTETRSGITGTEKVEITLTESQFESHDYGEYTLEIKCTQGSITYDSTIDVYYHQ